MLTAIGLLALAALAAPTVLAALAFRRAGVVLWETRRIHLQLATIIGGAQKRAQERRNDKLSGRHSAPPPGPLPCFTLKHAEPPPLPVGPKLELNLEEDWEEEAVDTELPGAPTDWGFQPSPRQRR